MSADLDGAGAWDGIWRGYLGQEEMLKAFPLKSCNAHADTWKRQLRLPSWFLAMLSSVSELN